MIRSILSGVLAIGLGSVVLAQEGAAPLAEVGLQPRITALSENAAGQEFELGLLMSLRAVEKTLQTRYLYGLGDRLGNLPVLRIDLGQRNPASLKAGPEVLAGTVRTMLSDLENARALLDAAEQGSITPFELTLQDIWFDVNRNGARETGEDAMEALAPLLLGRRALRDMEESALLETPLTVRFDQADHAWLTAYTHMLSGVGSLFLAFDPTPILKDLEEGRARLAQAPIIPNTFDPELLKAGIEALNIEKARLDAALKPLEVRERELSDQMRTLRNAKPRDDAAIETLNLEIRRIREEDTGPLRAQTRAIRAEINAAQAKLRGPQPNLFSEFSNDIDAIYVIIAALRQQPDPARITAARDHWLSMIAHNKAFWAALEQETDNEREWIPNSRQTSAIPVVVDAPLIASWQGILEDAESVLEGRLLLPHPLLLAGTGVSLKAYAANPSPINLIDWIHGIGAYKYAARGPMITRQRWLSFQRLTRGNAGGFALFFN